MRMARRRLCLTALTIALATPALAQERPESTCGAEAQLATDSAAPEVCPESSGARPPSIRWRDLALAVLIVATGFSGIAFVRANEQWRRLRREPRRDMEWAPYVTGALMGLLITASMVAFGRPVGASGAVQNLAGVLGQWLTPRNQYWGPVIPVGVTWQVWVLIGLVLGGFVGASLSGEVHLTTTPPPGWAQTWGSSRLVRWTIGFGAAALIEFASGISGGCTSGLALSGGVVLSPAAFVFMAAMFATGVPTAHLVLRRRRS